ncbi:MAG: hypothetical protein IJS90_10025 [Clostridia bacterium]|nr:hypothetical protein [Clostridia bacterium]
MKSYAKKALSVLLAAMMCLSLFAMVDFSKLTAEAYTDSPTHTFKIKLERTFTDGGYDGQDGGGTMTLYGKNQNGNGSQGTISSGSITSSWAYTDSENPEIGPWTTNLWPTKMYIGVNISKNNSMFYKSQTITTQVRLYVLNAATNSYVDAGVIGSFSLSSDTTSGGGGSSFKSATFDLNTTGRPYAAKVATSYNANGNATDTVDVTLNATGGANKTQSFSAYVYDQYNVGFRANPSAWSQSGTTACTTSLSTTGSSENCTLTMSATNATYQKATCTVKATYGSLYHQWNVVITPTYKINFNVSTNGGTSTAPGSATVANTNTGSASVNYTLQSSQTASKTNSTTGTWTFVGWNGSSTATTGTKPTSAIAIDNYNDTLYAIFSKTATATFHWYNASGTKVTSTNTKTIYNNATQFTFDVPKSSVPTSITVNGTTYTFAGWAVDSTTKTTADHAASVTTATRNANTGTTYNFYALYTGSVTLYYNNNGGSGSPAAQTSNLTLNCGANATAANNASGRATFTINPNNVAMSRSYSSAFVGWNTTQKDDETAQYKDGTVTWSASSSLPTTITIVKNTTLYASYYDFRYNVKFYDYKGTVIKTQTIRHNYSATAPTMKTNAEDPSHRDSGSHYVFDHWEYTDGSEYNDADKLTINTNGYTYNVYAKYIGHKHIWGEPFNLQGATTCTTGLTYKMQCTVCGYVRDFEEEPLGHEFQLIGVAEPTCTTPGSYGKLLCKNCGAEDPTYSVVIDGVETVITDDNRIIPALGHDYGEVDFDNLKYTDGEHEGEYIVAPETVEATCTTAGYYYYTCARCGREVRVENIPATGHDWDEHARIEPTCTDDGEKAYTVCLNCGLFLDGEEDPAARVINALGHSFELVEETDSTCTVAGHYAYYECSRCGKFFELDQETEIADISVKDKPLADHTYSLVSGQAATCTEPGYEDAYLCTMCGQVQPGTTPGAVIDALGHNISLYLAANAPTCQAAGNIAVYKCSRCNKFFSDAQGETEIEENSWNRAQVPHAMTNLGSAPTCTENGKEDYYYCSLCEKYYVDAAASAEIDPASVAVIDSLGHDWSQWYVTIEATDTAEGRKTRFCNRCGETQTQVIDRLPHELTFVAANNATCEGSGNIAYYVCESCGAKFADAQGQTPVTNVSINPLGHDFDESITANVSVIEATCAEAGSKTVKCSRCEAEDYTVIEATGLHTAVPYGEAVTATCAVNGLIPGSICSVCGEILVEPRTVPRSTHTPESSPRIDTVIAATCEGVGYTGDTYCSVCGQIVSYGVSIEARGHRFGDLYEYRAATCTEYGEKRRDCADCDAYIATETPALGHSVVTDKAVAATCENAGLTAGSHCAVCGEVFTAQQVIEQLPHSYAVTSEVATTCTVLGYKQYTCVNGCGDTYRVYDTAKLPHVVGTPATCTAAAVCANCGRSFGSTVDHNYECVSNTDSTCTEHGIRTFKCSMCGDTYTEEKELIDHRLNVEDSYGVEPTCTERGYSAIKCEICGEYIIEYDDAPLGHDYVDGVCTRCGEADPNYNPSNPSGGDEGGSGQGLNIFQRIVNFFKNLIKKITSIFSR